jgi:hypothetical protein
VEILDGNRQAHVKRDHKSFEYLIVWDESFVDQEACPLLQYVVVRCQVIHVVGPLSVSESHNQHIAT